MTVTTVHSSRLCNQNFLLELVSLSALSPAHCAHCVINVNKRKLCAVVSVVHCNAYITVNLVTRRCDTVSVLRQKKSASNALTDVRILVQTH